MAKRFSSLHLQCQFARFQPRPRILLLPRTPTYPRASQTSLSTLNWHWVWHTSERVGLPVSDAPSKLSTTAAAPAAKDVHSTTLSMPLRAVQNSCFYTAWQKSYHRLVIPDERRSAGGRIGHARAQLGRLIHSKGRPTVSTRAQETHVVRRLHLGALGHGVEGELREGQRLEPGGGGSKCRVQCMTPLPQPCARRATGHHTTILHASGAHLRCLNRWAH